MRGMVVRSSEPSAHAQSYGSDQSLQALRADLVRATATGLIVLALSLIMSLVFISGKPLFETWAIAPALVGIGLLAHRLSEVQARLAGAILIGGLLVVMTASLYLHSGVTAAPGAALVAVLAGALLGPRLGVATAGVASGIILVVSRTSPDLLPASSALTALFFTWTGAALSWLITRPTSITLEWAWSSYQEALERAEALRDRQGELGRVSKSLTETCVLLEEANRELQRAREAADVARRLKAEFAASISHELRTPLNLIVGFAEMMVMAPHSYRGETLPESYRGDVEAIYRNACHLSSLVDDVLDLSQIEAHRLALYKERVSLQEIVDEAVATMASLFTDKGLSLEVQIPEGLPLLNVDRTRVRQILINLLNNAARFTTRGGARVAATSNDQEVVVSVADTGLGIAEEDVPRAFEEFRQFGTSTRHRAGSGLGLSICKRLTELHGGSIRLESRSGQGSTFYFTLPRCDNVVTLPYRTDAGKWAGALATEEPLRTVIVVDRDPQVVKLFQRYLDGYHVVGVDSIERPLRASGAPPTRALVLTKATDDGRQRGLEMVGHDTLIATVRLHTGRDAGKELGVAAYLGKPVTREQLSATLVDLRLGRRLRHVLVVDDDPGMVQLLTRMIGSLRKRCKVTGAYSGSQALARLRESRPDVVLLDLLMPDGDGYDVLREMATSDELRSVPVVVITAKGQHDEEVAVEAVEIAREDSLTVGEAMRCLRAGLDALWDPVARSTDPGPREALVG